MSFSIYNSLNQKKEIFTPLNPPIVKMYCCGPTVYDLLHIGNFRGAVVFNLLRQWLEHKNYKVIYAYNFTDVDDKILNRAKKENKTMKEIADTYIQEFKKDFQSLKLKKHEYNPQATQFIPEMIQLIKTLLQKEKAYMVDRDIFYSVKNFSDYGKLSKRTKKEKPVPDYSENSTQGVVHSERPSVWQARVEADERKKDLRDFALWKSCSEEEPGWDSPWGRGRPGWHLECTTMIFSLLGNNIDIHGGGSDLLFPHHENELAQAEGAKPGPFVKYWVHNNMFTFGGEKMAKSTGNVSIMRAFLEEYNGEIFKYLVLSAHYRSITEVSENKVSQCIQALSRVYTFLQTTEMLFQKYSNFSAIIKQVKENKHYTQFLQKIKSARHNIETYLDDDLNTPSALAVIFTLIRQFNEKRNHSQYLEEELALYAKYIQEIIIDYGKIMSLFQEPPNLFLKEMDNIFLKKNNISRKEVNKLVMERELARKTKNFKKADEIRAKLIKMNIEVKDSPTGTTWETNKNNLAVHKKS